MKKQKPPLGQTHHTIVSYDLSNPKFKQIITESEWKPGLIEKRTTPYSLEFDAEKKILLLYLFERHYESKNHYEKNLFLFYLLSADKRKCAEVEVTINHFLPVVAPEIGETNKRETFIDDEYELKEASTIPGMLKQALEKKKKKYGPKDLHFLNDSIRIEKLEKHAPIGSIATSVAVLAAGFATGFCLPEYTNLIASVTAAAIALIIIVSVSVAITQKKYRKMTPKMREKLLDEMHPVHRINLEKLKEEAAALLEENGVEASTDDLPKPKSFFDMD